MSSCTNFSPELLIVYNDATTSRWNLYRKILLIYKTPREYNPAELLHTVWHMLRLIQRSSLYSVANVPKERLHVTSPSWAGVNYEFLLPNRSWLGSCKRVWLDKAQGKQGRVGRGRVEGFPISWTKPKFLVEIPVFLCIEMWPRVPFLVKFFLLLQLRWVPLFEMI